MSSLFQDLRYGARMLWKSPGFTAVAVLTLALGIGANTTIFSLIDALLLKTLPVEKPKELVIPQIPAERGGYFGFSYPLFEALRDHNRTLDGVFTSAGGAFNVSVDGQAELAPGGGLFVSSSYFAVLGVRAAAGRTFTVDDDRDPGAHAEAVISYRYWKRRFRLDAAAVGKVIHVNGSPVTVIGVTPREFFAGSGGRAPDVTVPFSMYAQLTRNSNMLGSRETWWLGVMGRLKPGVTMEQAAADLNVVFQQYLAETGGNAQKAFASRKIVLESGSRGSSLGKQMAVNLPGMLMATVGLVLLIACANVANLVLARNAARQREIALRLALGSGRARLVRHLLAESLLLSLTGGAAGLLFAFWGTEGIVKLLERGPAPLPVNLSPDARVFIFTAAVSLLTGVLVGLAPALRATRADLIPALKEGGQQSTAGLGRNRLRSALVVSQVALSLVLLVVACLFLRTLQKLASVELGFDSQRVLLISIDPTLVGYKGESLAALYNNLLGRLEAIPGARSASLSRFGLLGRGAWQNHVSVPGYSSPPEERPSSHFSPVGAHFFRTAGIPVLFGRDFGPQDNETGRKVAIVNETFVRDFFSGESPVGRSIGLGVNQNLGQFEVVGVVKDSKQRGLREPPVRVVYFPFLQMPPALLGPVTLEVRVAGDPMQMIAGVRREALAVEKNLPILAIKSATQQVEESLGEDRTVTALTSLFGLLALLLAGVGLYGVMAYSVARRTRELGIRMALGARRHGVVALVLREAMTLVSVGVVIGLVAAFAAGRLVSNLLFGLEPTDIPAISAATLLLISVAMLACYVPARRASRVDPMIALRYE